MRNLSFTVLVLGLACLVQPALASPIPEHARKAAAYVEFVSDKTLAVLGEPSLSESLRETRLRDVLGDGFAIPAICRQVVGDAWASAQPAKRRAFCDSFRGYLLGYLAGVLEDGAPEDFEVTGAERIDGQDIHVRTSVRRLGLSLAEIGWVVREEQGSLKIVDVVTNGVSLIGTYRSEFRSFVSREGIEALTVALNRKSAGR